MRMISLCCISLCLLVRNDQMYLIFCSVFYEGLETVRPGIEILETTPAGKSANVNNKSGKAVVFINIFNMCPLIYVFFSVLRCNFIDY